MLNDREKLIELLTTIPTTTIVMGRSCGRKLVTASFIADYLIANGVTVREKGEWIDHACSCCGKVNPTLEMNGWGDYVSQNTNYCGNCGADMRGEEHG